MSFAEMLEQLPTLTPDERQLLVNRVMELEEDDSFTPEQLAEIDRRIADADAHPELSIPAEEVMARLKNKFPPR